MYGITATGFTPKTLEIILAEMLDDLKSDFGEINTADDSVLSQVVRPAAQQLTELWEAALASWQAGTPNGASGVTLDALVALNFVTRLPATKTIVQAAITGDVGTIVPDGTLATDSQSGKVFVARAEATIDIGTVTRVTIGVLTVADSTVYSVTINGTVYDITSAGSALEAEIVSALVADLAAASAIATVVNNNDGTLTLTSTDSETPFSVSCSSNLEIQTVWTPQEYEAAETGNIACPAGSLDTITTPVPGLSGIINLVDGVIGRNVETDAALRLRRLQALSALGSGTLASIRAKLLTDVADVTSVFGYENVTDATDVAGRPPHSIEIVVAGGTDLDIVRAIHSKRAAGVATYGNVNGGAGISFEDDEGFDQVVRFSRPVNRYAWIDIEYSLYSEEDFPSDGEDQIAAAVLAFGNANSPIGKDFILQRFIGPCMIPGVASVTIQIAVTTTSGGTPSYGSSNIAIGETEVLVFDSTRITVAEA